MASAAYSPGATLLTFAQLISEFDTVEEMRADLAASVEQMIAAEQVASGRDKVLEAAGGRS